MWASRGLAELKQRKQMNLAFGAESHTDYFVVESFIDSRELHCKRNAKDDMKRMLLNGEYLTKSGVRRKDKELQRKKNTENVIMSFIIVHILFATYTSWERLFFKTA